MYGSPKSYCYNGPYAITFVYEINKKVMKMKDQDSMNLVWKRLAILIGVSYLLFNICVILSNANSMPAIWRLVNVRILMHFM